jgi:CBS domain-containing protein
VTLVREAMVTEPASLDVTASAQEAGELLARPEVRAIFVCRDEQLVGVVTRKTLVREVVAAGRDPGTTPVGGIAEEPYLALEGEMPLEAAFWALEEHDLERVPVVEAGRLVGVLSRVVIQRRLVEDEPLAETEDSGD